MLLLQVAAPQAPVELDTVAIGARVRVRFPGKGRDYYTTGSLASVTPDGVVLTTSVGGRSLDWAEVGAVERPAGKKSAWRDGMALGMIVGFAVGGAIGLAHYDPCPVEPSWCIDFGPGFEFGGGGMAGMAAGGLVGGILGAAIGKTRWEPVVLPGGGLGARVTLR
jgi:hypothetical protein